MKRLLTVLSLLSISATAYSEGSPWLPADGTSNLSLSYTSGSTEEFFIGEDSIDLDGTLEGTFVWLNASYGYDDIWAFDIRTGYANSEFVLNESEFDAIPDEESDISDTSFGVTYQFINEFEADNGLPTIAARLGYTVGGDYETDLLIAIGDGASGLDLSLLVGKSLTPSVSVYGDLTYRQRDSGVADGVKYLVGGYYNSPIPRLGVLLSLAGIRTDSDIDIGGPDFGVDQFPQTDRDSDWAIAGLNYGFTNGFGLGFSYSSLINGRNVADSDIATFTLAYSF